MLSKFIPSFLLGALLSFYLLELIEKPNICECPKVEIPKCPSVQVQGLNIEDIRKMKLREFTYAPRYSGNVTVIQDTLKSK
jgi:hypothetical protein